MDSTNQPPNQEPTQTTPNQPLFSPPPAPPPIVQKEIIQPPQDQPNPEKEIKNQQIKSKLMFWSGCAFELAKGVIALSILIFLVHYFIATIFVVEGQSMEPNFHTGEYIVVNRLSYLTIGPQRGDVVVLKFPGDPEKKKYIKRVIGLPGETLEIKNGKIYINSQLIQEDYLPADLNTQPMMKTIIQSKEYFLMGDNRLNSSDSRIWGTAPKNKLIGKAKIIFYPHWAIVRQPNYQ
jgi:signal peptidase I